MIDQILLRDVIGVPFHVEKAMNSLALKTLTTLHKGVENGLSAAMKSLIVCIVGKVVFSPQELPKLRKASLKILDLWPQRQSSSSRNNVSTLKRE